MKAVFSFPQTHSGSVWRVTWAHPEFGQVLASCSFDRTAAVWEEIVGESNDKQRGLSHWVSTGMTSYTKTLDIVLENVLLCKTCVFNVA